MAEPPGDFRPYLGRKISIRFRLDDDSGYPFSEAVGVVQSVTGSEEGKDLLSIRKRRGEVVSVPVASILAVKVFPLAREGRPKGRAPRG